MQVAMHPQSLCTGRSGLHGVRHRKHAAVLAAAARDAQPLPAQVLQQPLQPSLQQGAACMDRRSLVLGGMAMGAVLQALPQPPAAWAEVDPEPMSPEEIYASYMYSSPRDILQYVYDRAPKGNADAVLRAIDEFSQAFPMYKVGPEKGAILEALVQLAQPSLVVELGSFVGYSAVRTARNLPPGAHVVCVEANPECVDALRGVVAHAELQGRVVVEQGLAGEVVPGLAAKYGQAQLVFLDHCKACYLPDLQRAQATGLLAPGAWLIADNVISPPPGTPELLQYIAQEGWSSTLIPAALEYSKPWDPDWKDQEDGMAVGVWTEGLDSNSKQAAEDKLRGFEQKLGGRALVAVA